MTEAYKNNARTVQIHLSLIRISRIYYSCQSKLLGKSREEVTEKNGMRCEYLVHFASFYIIGFPFTINAHDLTSLNVANCFMQTINFINPDYVFYN